jgi:Uma2 family endonuclease
MSINPEQFLTVADLDLMPDDGNRYELISGELHVSKTPGMIHQTASGEIFYSIKSFLIQNPIGVVVTTPGVIFSNIDAVIPDLVFMASGTVGAAVQADRIHGAPDLAIEILYPGTENARRDRVAKRYLYAKFGVKEYWVVDPVGRHIEIYLLDGATLMLSATLGEDEEVTSTLLPGYKCRVGDFFV